MGYGSRPAAREDREEKSKTKIGNFDSLLVEPPCGQGMNSGFAQAMPGTAE